MFKLLYRTGKTEKGFSKLELVNKSGKEISEISPFFQKHLENIFPELELFMNEKKTTGYYLKGVKKSPDAICGYPKGQFFVILEYKSKEPHELMRQIRKYLGAISGGEKAPNKDCIDLFENLNTQFPKDKSVSGRYKDIKGNETKLIGISPELPEEDGYYEFDDIIGVESQGYELDNEIAVVLESEDEEGLLEKLSGKKEFKATKAEIKSLSQLFQEMKVVDKKVKEQAKKFHNIVKKLPLSFNFYYPKKHFGMYDGLIRYYTKDGEKFFWLTVGKYIRVYFPLKTGKESQIIKDENSFLESLSIIKEILIKQANRNE